MSIFEEVVNKFFRPSRVEPGCLVESAPDTVESRGARDLSRSLNLVNDRLPEYRQVADETESALADVKKLVGDDSFDKYGYVNHPAITSETRQALIEHRNRAISYFDEMDNTIWSHMRLMESAQYHGFSSEGVDAEIAATKALARDTSNRLYNVAHNIGGPIRVWYSGAGASRIVYDPCAPGMEWALDDIRASITRDH